MKYATPSMCLPFNPGSVPQVVLLPVVAGHEAGANAIVAEASVKPVGRENVAHFHEQKGE